MEKEKKNSSVLFYRIFPEYVSVYKQCIHSLACSAGRHGYRE